MLFLFWGFFVFCFWNYQFFSRLSRGTWVAQFIKRLPSAQVFGLNSSLSNTRIVTWYFFFSSLLSFLLFSPHFSHWYYLAQYLSLYCYILHTSVPWYGIYWVLLGLHFPHIYLSSKIIQFSESTCFKYLPRVLSTPYIKQKARYCFVAPSENLSFRRWKRLFFFFLHRGMIAMYCLHFAIFCLFIQP